MLTEFLHIGTVDFIFYLLFNKILSYKITVNYSNTTRWFLLHSIINFIVVYYSLNDISNCILNSNECFKINWNENSIKVYNYAFILHIYHCIFFNLTRDDYIHHISMVAICGTLCYLIKSIISSLALFFLSGLPGAIDYFLLFLVKINKMSAITEKKIYLYLSAFLRAPGCVITFFIGTHGLFEYYFNDKYYEFMLLFLTLNLIFWNGQYYLLKSHESYIKKQFVNVS